MPIIYPYYTRLTTFMSHALNGEVGQLDKLQRLERYHLKLELSEEGQEYSETLLQFGLNGENIADVIIGNDSTSFQVEVLHKTIMRLLDVDHRMNRCTYHDFKYPASGELMGDGRLTQSMHTFAHENQAPTLAAYFRWAKDWPSQVYLAGEASWVQEASAKIQEYYRNLLGPEKIT